jgi:hypothetical protein
MLQAAMTPFIPHFNVVVEGANRTIIDFVQCRLDDGGISKQFWALQAQWWSISRTTLQRNLNLAKLYTIPGMGGSNC